MNSSSSMDQFKSKSQVGARNMQLEVYSRSYSTSYQFPYDNNYMRDAKKGKSKSYKGWLNDPEFQRKKRVAKYKSFTVERKVKGSFTKSFRWLKDRYYRMMYGWW
jgi:Domain of unknown function (DUF3511)